VHIPAKAPTEPIIANANNPFVKVFDRDDEGGGGGGGEGDIDGGGGDSEGGGGAVV